MKIFILGCGYIGYNLSELLKNKDNEVIVLGIESPYVSLCENFEYIDVFNPNKLSLITMKDAIVIDAIGLVANNAISEDEITLLKQLQEKYHQLLAVLKQKEIKRFIYLSSGGTIYGESREAIAETFPLHPQTLYAKSKVCIENEIIRSGLQYLIIRLANPFGGYQDPMKRQGIIPIMIRKALLDETLELWTDITTVRDYIYISDMAKAFMELIVHDVKNEIVNLGSGCGTSIAELIHLVEINLQKKLNIAYRQSDVKVIEAIILDIKKLKSLTKFKTEVSLEVGVQSEIERIKKEINIK